MYTLKNTLCKVLIFLLLVLVCSSAALAADEPYVIPLDTENTQAVLLIHGDERYLIGGSNMEATLQAMESQNITSLAAVITPCSHKEHSSASQQLADHFQVASIIRSNPLFPEGINLEWLEQGVRVEAYVIAVTVN